MKMVVENSAHLTECRSSFMRAVNRAVILTKERTSSHENVADRISDLKVTRNIFIVDLYVWSRGTGKGLLVHSFP